MEDIEISINQLNGISRLLLDTHSSLIKIGLLDKSNDISLSHEVRIVAKALDYNKFVSANVSIKNIIASIKNEDKNNKILESQLEEVMIQRDYWETKATELADEVVEYLKICWRT